MKQFIQSAKSTLLKIRQQKAKAEVKIIEADNKYTPSIADAVASTIWNIIRIAVLPAFTALIFCFFFFLFSRSQASVQSVLAYFFITSFIAFCLSVCSLMCNYVRGELRFCRERVEARELGFYSFSEASTFLINAAIGKSDVTEALALTNKQEPLKIIERDIRLFHALPAILYFCAFVGLVFAHSMSLGAVALLVGMVSLLVAFVNDKISSRQNLAYFVMAAYKFR